jgi:hypothetical protein
LYCAFIASIPGAAFAPRSMRRVSPTMTAPRPMLAKPIAPKPAAATAVASRVDRRGKNPDMPHPRMMCQWPLEKRGTRANTQLRQGWRDDSRQ